ncbi:MAG: lipocalin family protein [Paludibacteraceae bacterium]|nr:lipocalin family protein [Paludibacteraceae bacterium]
MKKSLYALLMVSLMMLVGCNKNENNDSKASSKLVGTWELVGGTLDGQAVSQSEIEELAGYRLTFNSDGTMNVTLGVEELSSAQVTATYELKDDMLYIDETVSFEGQTIHAEESYHVDKLTNSELILSKTKDGVTATIIYKKVS